MISPFCWLEQPFRPRGAYIQESGPRTKQTGVGTRRTGCRIVQKRRTHDLQGPTTRGAGFVCAAPVRNTKPPARGFFARVFTEEIVAPGAQTLRSDR